MSLIFTVILLGLTTFFSTANADCGGTFNPNAQYLNMGVHCKSGAATFFSSDDSSGGIVDGNGILQAKNHIPEAYLDVCGATVSMNIPVTKAQESCFTRGADLSTHLPSQAVDDVLVYEYRQLAN